MKYFSSPQQCTKCNGYITLPTGWSSTGSLIMCNCPKISLSWTCHRCNKVNAPWKGSCDCTPSPMSSPISSPITNEINPYTAGPISLNHFYNEK